MTDQLEALFADLRSDTVQSVRPPGTDAARRTVHRRRQTRLAAVAGAAVLTLTGGAVWAGHPGADLPSPVVGPGTTDVVTAARAVVDESVGSVATVEGSGRLDGTAFGEDTGSSGDYSIFVACATPDAVNLMLVTIHTPGTARGLAAEWVPCDRSPKLTRIRFHLPRLTTIKVSLTADTVDDSKLGYAYKVVADVLDPVEEPSELSEANASRALDLVRTAGGTGSLQSYTSETDLAVWVGKYDMTTTYLRIACAGPGAVRAVAISLGTQAGPVDPIVGPVLAERTVRCTAEGATVKVPLTIPALGSLGLELRPDATARNKVGLAITVDDA
ncbi:hypothetical protein ACWKSP_12295 [Micromonosporaceae bacterium Da 78-11]